VDVEPLYDMSHYWDKSAEQKRLSELPTEQDRIKQIAIILELNARVIGNAEVVHRTLHALEQGLAAVPEPWRLLQNANDGFFDARSYFSRDTSYEGFHVDLKVMTDFLAFVQPLGADTIHFKFL
jgi:hypothetical protein